VLGERRIVGRRSDEVGPVEAVATGPDQAVVLIMESFRGA
jgi:hypothetical protein